MLLPLAATGRPRTKAREKEAFRSQLRAEMPDTAIPNPLPNALVAQFLCRQRIQDEASQRFPTGTHPTHLVAMSSPRYKTQLSGNSAICSTAPLCSLCMDALPSLSKLQLSFGVIRTVWSGWSHQGPVCRLCRILGTGESDISPMACISIRPILLQK